MRKGADHRGRALRSGPKRKDWLWVGLEHVTQ